MAIYPCVTGKTRAAQLLAAWRSDRGLTQTHVAALFDVRQATLSEYESGRKVPRTQKALDIDRLTEGAVPIGAWGEAPEPEVEAATAEGSAA